MRRETKEYSLVKASEEKGKKKERMKREKMERRKRVDGIIVVEEREREMMCCVRKG